MKDELKRYDQIERYLDGEMPEGEQQAFEQQMALDETLREEVALSLEAREAIVDHNLIAFKEKLNAYDPGKTFSWKKWLGIGFLILLSALSVYHLSSKEATVTEKEVASEKTSTQITASTKEEKHVDQSKQSSLPTIPEDDNMLSNNVEPNSTARVDSINDSGNKIDKNEEKKGSSTDQKKETPDSTPQVFSCKGFKLTYQLKKENTCPGEAKGSIMLTEIEGGLAPYSFSLDADNYTSNNAFSSLEAGAYTVVIKDKNECVDIADVVIEKAFCGPDYVKAFNPDMGEMWKIPYDSDKSGIFNVMNRKNKLVYSHQFSGQNPEKWNGKNSMGEILSMGYYIFELKYADGKTFAGGVSIVR